MPLTTEQQQAADALRAVGFGDRKIASALEVTYGTIRHDRETRLVDFDPEAAAAGEQTGYRHWVIPGDLQVPFQADEAVSAVKEYVEVNQPDGIVQIGDFADFFSLSTFRKELPPKDRLYLNEEVREVKRELREWAALAPDAELLYVVGNHEERLYRYLEDKSSELFGLDNMALDKLLDFEGTGGWQQMGRYGDGFWLGDHEGGLWVTHGDYVRKFSGWSAKAHIEAMGRSVIHGHTHRLGSYYLTFGETTFGAFEVGSLCDPTKTPRGASFVNWQYGFASVWTSEDSPRFHVDLVAITDGGFVTGGKKYGK